MSEQSKTSRRDFLSTSVAATAALVGQQVLPRSAHAAESDVLKVALVGCGGRGTGAASQILQAHPSVRLWAMADLFGDKLESALERLQKGVDARYDREAHQAQASVIEVPPERRFVGFDAYRKAIDSGVDVVILATTPHFRPMQFAYAVSRHVHAFIEKPVAVDAPGVRTVLEAAAAAKEKSEWIHGKDGTCELRQYRGATIEGANAWRVRDRGNNAYQLEHNAFVDAIRNDKPYNEGELAAMSCMMSVMARMANYSGVEVTWEKALNSQHRLGPETYTWESQPPLLPGPDGTYEHAVPVPGIYKPY